jgi:hypothetical protein
MRRSPVALAVLVGLALTASACGSSSKSSDTTAPATSGGSGDSGGASGGATAVLKSIDRTVGASPQKITLDVSLDIKGTPTNAQLAVFTKQPIHVKLDGVVDNGTSKGGDVNLDVDLGSTPIAAEIRYGGGKTWLKIDDKWYVLPADTLSSATGTSLPTGTASSLDVNKIIGAMGDSAGVFKNATVSDDTVEGIDSDKVSADVNFAQLGTVVAKGIAAMGTSASATTPADVDTAVAELQKTVKNAHVDMWVGKSDHKIHRSTITADAVLDAASKASTGIESVKVTFDATTVDGSAPDLSAPATVGSQAEFQTALVGLLGKVMGGASTG